MLIAAEQLQGFPIIGFFGFLSAGLWLIAVFLPLGLINPFAAIDNPDPTPPSALRLALLVYPWVATSLFAIHVLGKYKNEFRWRPKPAA